MDKYLRLDKERSTHPLFQCSSQEFNKLKENTILIGNPRVSDNHRQTRKIYYDILSIGSNIRSVNKGKRMIIKLRNTKKNAVFIMIHQKFLKNIDRIQKHQYTNGSKHRQTIRKGRYVVLLTCCATDRSWQKNGIIFNDTFVTMMKKTYPNQIRNQGAKHFGSEGQIFSIGYAAKYEKLDHKQQSFSKYVQSKSMCYVNFHFIVLLLIIFLFLNYP